MRENNDVWDCSGESLKVQWRDGIGKESQNVHGRTMKRKHWKREAKRDRRKKEDIETDGNRGRKYIIGRTNGRPDGRTD